MEMWQSWLNACDSKSYIQATVSRVRIPSSPPRKLNALLGILFLSLMMSLGLDPEMKFLGSTMSKRKRALRSLSANECGNGIYAEPILSPRP